MDINFILVEPKVPENIGASARALMTMGYNKLCLVNPCSDPEGKANWLAHGSLNILDNARIFNSLEAAIDDADLVIATTARKRGIQRDIIDISDLNTFISGKLASTRRVAIIFGSEESGLSNKEMKLCDVATYIPMANLYPSLNLSQSVMIIAYELSKSESLNSVQEEKGIINKGDSLRTLKSKITHILTETEIAKNQNLAGRILERVGHLNDSDIKLLHSVSATVLEKLREEKK